LTAQGKGSGIIKKAGRADGKVFCLASAPGKNGPETRWNETARRLTKVIKGIRKIF
jgi:hypothetical protein